MFKNEYLNKSLIFQPLDFIDVLFDENFPQGK